MSSCVHVSYQVWKKLVYCIRTQATIKGAFYKISYVRFSFFSTDHLNWNQHELQQANRSQHIKFYQNQQRNLWENECRRFCFPTQQWLWRMIKVLRCGHQTVEFSGILHHTKFEQNVQKQTSIKGFVVCFCSLFFFLLLFSAFPLFVLRSHPSRFSPLNTDRLRYSEDEIHPVNKSQQ